MKLWNVYNTNHSKTTIYPICRQCYGDGLLGHQGVIMTNYLSKGSTVTGAYYVNEIYWATWSTAEQATKKAETRSAYLLHDNALQLTAHTAGVATSVAAECGYELPQPAYSPDLSPSDFYLFPLLKEHIRGRQYASDNDIIQSAEDFLELQDELFYQTGTQKCRNDGISALKFKEIT